MSVNIVVPEMGESIVDARVARWLKKEGDPVTVGEPLVELETDKVDVEVSAQQNGVLERIAHQQGADVKIGEVLGTIAAGAATAAPDTSALAAAAKPIAKAGAERDVAATPSARKAAREQDVQLSAVSADGPRVTKADVEKSARPATTTPAPNPVPSTASASPATPATVPAGASAPRVAAAADASRPASAPRDPIAASPGARTEERVRMSKRRATIAKRLVEVQQTAAMLTTFNEVDMSAVMSLRERHKEAFKTRFGISLGIASFFVKATVVALREFPRLNAEIQGDEMVLKHYYDIGVAVGAAEGLVVPVLRS
ncbi:MAG: 2-oxo acid dehydrogenase subunit E2, partial [Acidobacteriota bacterium]